MKKWMIVLFLYCSFTVNAQFTTASVQVNGLVCSLCTKSVIDALQKIPFVEKVSVNLQTQQYYLLFKKSISQDFNLLRNAIEDAGFSISSFQVTGLFTGTSIHASAPIFIGTQKFIFLQVLDTVLNGEKTLTIIDPHFCDNKLLKRYHSVSVQPISGSPHVFHVMM